MYDCAEWVTQELQDFCISNNWLAARPTAVGAPPSTRALGAGQLLWDMLGHHSRWIRPPVPSRSSTHFLHFQCPECPTHCSSKPNSCTSFHTAGRLSHFPRMYVFSQTCLPMVRKMVFAVAQVATGKNSLGFWGPWEERLREKRKTVNISCTSALCQALGQGPPSLLSAFPAGTWGRRSYIHLPDEKTGSGGLKDLLTLHHYEMVDPGFQPSLIDGRTQSMSTRSTAHRVQSC